MTARPAPRLRLLVAAVAGIALLASAGTARADLLLIQGGGSPTHPSAYTGSIEVRNQTTTSAVLEVKLTNQSTNAFAAGAANGFITGFGFNDQNSANTTTGWNITNLSVTVSGTNNFQVVSGANADQLGALGKFDYGVSVGPTLHTSGNASDGVAVGEGEVTFTFLVSGQGLTNLTAASLLAEPSSNTTTPQGFGVRFRGYSFPLYGGDGDKVPLGKYGPPSPPPPSGVPAPPGLVLAGMGFGCVLLGRLRFRRNSTDIKA